VTALSKTFALRTPADLLDKLRLEAELLWSSDSPADLRLRTYLVLNCAITAWQMKDWVYNSLRASERLDALHAFAGRRIKSAEDFGIYLREIVPEIAMAHQLATAAKHFEIRQNRNDPNIFTVIERIDHPARDGYDAELYVCDADGTMSAPDLMIWLYSRWCDILQRLGLSRHASE
jgi:hypothetical protein